MGSVNQETGAFVHLDAGALEVHQQWFMVLENARLPKNQDWMACSRPPGLSIAMGIPKLAGWFMMENPWKIHLEMDDFLGYPHDLGNLHIGKS